MNGPSSTWPSVDEVGSPSTKRSDWCMGDVWKQSCQRRIGWPSNDGALPVATRCDIYWTKLGKVERGQRSLRLETIVRTLLPSMWMRDNMSRACRRLVSQITQHLNSALHIKIANADDDAPLGRRVIVFSSALRLSPSASEDRHGERRIQCSPTTATGRPGR